jgi:hypothetical protein
LHDGSVSLHGARIKANPNAKTEVDKFALLAHSAALAR